MENKNKVTIVYISTGDYNDYYKGFIQSLPMGVGIEVIRFSDITEPYIPKLPWPLTALLKFHYLRDAIANLEDNDYIFYVNANFRFTSEFRIDEIIKNKIITVPHHAWEKEGCNDLNFTYGKPINPKSVAHIPEPYLYRNSGFFGGPVKLMKDAVREIVNWTEYDLKYNIIPAWHDESYWNKWCYLNPDKIITMPCGWVIDSCSEYELNNYLHPHAIYADSTKTQLQKER